MRKKFALSLAILCMVGFTGCASKAKEQTSSGPYDLYEGYLTIDGDQLLINDFEFIDGADQYWINKLKLTSEDMLNGYYIHDVSDELLSFTLTEETRYNFYDTMAQFVSEDNKDRLYTTTNIDVFLEKFGIDETGALRKTPFEVQAFEDGRVISISEIFVN